MSRFGDRPSDPDSPLWPRLTLAVLGAALVLRLALIGGGGQGFWPDETRYLAAVDAVRDMSSGQAKAGWLELVGTADHLFFKVAALPPAWLDVKFGRSPERAAAYFSLFSVAALALVGSCARAAGASRREAWLAVFFATLANSLFYYSRHLFPYDVSLALLMGSLALGLGRAPPRVSFAAGLLAGLGFLTYLGYWLLGGVILVVHVVRAPGLRAGLVRALVAGAGLVLPIALAVLAARALGGDLVHSLRAFSSTISQGDFGRGHALVWEFLWSAEGVLLPLWALAAVYAIIRGRSRGFAGRPWTWVAMAFALYAGLTVSADVLHAFVVYGRTARMIVPFACLAAAWSVNEAWSSGRLRNSQARALLALAALVASVNLLGSLAVTFPPRFMAGARRIVVGSGSGVYRVENARWLRPGEVADDSSQPGDVLLQRRNPLQFRPYQFEGYNRAERAYLTGHDIGMRLKRMDIAAPVGLAGYPGPIRLRIRFAESAQGAVEPLVAAGSGRNSCLVFVRTVDAARVAFGYAGSGEETIEGSPFQADYGREHDLLLFVGEMLPAEAPKSEAGIGPSSWEKLRHGLLVMLDGRVALAGTVVSHPSTAGEIKVGVDFGVLALADSVLHSTISSVAGVSPTEILGLLRAGYAGYFRQDPAWAGYPGPLHLAVEVPGRPGEWAEPLVTVAGPVVSESLSLARGADGAIRIKHAQNGVTTAQSLPLSMEAGRRMDLIVSMPGMMPPPDSAFYMAHPLWRILGDEVFVEANGKAALARRSQGVASKPSEIRLLADTLHRDGMSRTYSGRVLAEEAADPAAVAGRLPPFGTELDSPPPPADGYPGPLRLWIRFPENAAGTAEPLLATGRTGAGDLVYVQYLGGNRARIGLDHWSVGGPLSGVIDLGAPGATHELVVSGAALMPPPESDSYARHPRWLDMRGSVWVALDGRQVILSPTASYPSLPEQIELGFNSIGATTAVQSFSGEIFRVEFAGPDLVLGGIRAARAQP